MIELIANEADVDEIAAATFEAADKAFESIQNDKGFLETVELMKELAVAAKSDDPLGHLKSIGIDLPDKPGVIDVGIALTDAVDRTIETKGIRSDFNELAHGALSSAVMSHLDERFGPMFPASGGERAIPGANPKKGNYNLQLWAGQPHENITLKIEDIHQPLSTDIPRPFHDLIEIAAYVYAADQKVRRSFKDADSFGGKWRRKFRFRIPVRCKPLWDSTEVYSCLVELLNFISDDYYEFEFFDAANPPALQLYLGDIIDEAEPSLDVEQVVMFSGGLDSLAGAIDETINQKRKTLLVSHRPTAKNNRILNTLIREIGNRADAKLEPMSVKIRASLQEKAAREYTQRTRSFLFASFGVALAKMLRLESLRFYENGVISLNLPICAQVVGSRATRTTHPRVLAGFEKLFSLIGERPFTVENPFLWKTKAEVIKVITDAGFGSSIAESVSCAHTWERKSTVTHCGTCSQCLDRRIAMLAADAEQFDPLDRYKVDVFTQQRPEDEDKILAANYINRANNVARLKSPVELAAKYPPVLRALAALPDRSQGNPARVFDLYKRHANEVGEAIDKLTALHSTALRQRTLPDGSLLYAIHQMGNSLRLPAVGENEQPRNFFWKRGSVWEFRYEGGKASMIQNNQKGCEYIQYLLARPNQRFRVYEVIGELTVDLVADIEAGAVDMADVAEGYQITKGEKLSDLGPQADERALREYKEKMIEMLEEAQDARASGDDAKADRLAQEAADINAELGKRTGIGGRPRKDQDDKKRQRDKVSQAIRRTIKEIAEGNALFGAHLEASIGKGEWLHYMPGSEIAWSTRA